MRDTKLSFIVLGALVALAGVYGMKVWMTPGYQVAINPSVADVQQSPALRTLKAVRGRSASGLPVYNWALGVSPFPTPRPLVDAVRQHADYVKYSSVEGIPELSEALSNKYSLPYYKIDAENVLVAPGLKHLLLDAQLAFGGEILHVVPSTFAYGDQTKLLGKHPVTIKTAARNNYKLTPEDIEAVCRRDPTLPRMLLFSHPNNPTGVIYNREELRELAHVLKKYGIIVLADEACLGCQHRGERLSMATFHPSLTVRMGSLSVDFGASGYRIGWAVFPSDLAPLKEAMAAVGSNSYSCAPVPQQYAAVAALSDSPEIKRYHNQMRFVLRCVSKDVTKRFNELGVETTSADSAWYSFLNFEPLRGLLKARDINTSEDLVNYLSGEVGIFFVPGTRFGLDPEDLVVRASYVDFDGAEAFKLVEGLDLQEEPPLGLSYKWAPRIHKALDTLGDWLQEQQFPTEETAGIHDSLQFDISDLQTVL